MQQAEQEEKLCSQLCKKIADLVKVVDKLFRNSHTAQLENVFLREELVELEALRKDNEQWKEKCDTLQAKLREEEERHKNECEKLQEMHKVEIDKLREEMNHREQVLVDKLQEKDHALADMEHQLGVKTVQGKELQASLSEYMKRYKAASTSRREAKAENDGLFSELVAVKSSMESMEEELDAVRAERDGLKRELEQQWEIERSGWEGEKRKLHEEISSLSDQVKKLQGQLLKMSHDSQEALLPLRGEGAQSSLRHSARKSQVDSSGSVLGKDVMLELERLRQEVSWYRLELMNREGNFNRMFAPHLPVSVADHSSALGKSLPLPKLEPKDSTIKRTKSLKTSKRTAVFGTRY